MAFGDVDPQEVLDHEGIDYRETSGSSGDQLNVKECPNCGDSNWKVYLNAETGYGVCFKCDTTYNIWTFMCDVLGTADKKVVGKFFSQIAGDTGFKPKKVAKVHVDVEVPEAVFPLSFSLPYSSGRNIDYLQDRGISGEYAARFKLRHCMMGHHTYQKDGKEVRQKFDDRIIIPVLDLDGELVSFQGRDITGDSDRKYLFPAQLPATGRFLYNGHEAKALRAKEVIMCEGAFDVIPTAIAIDQFDEMRGVVPIGSFGKHLSTGAVDRPGQLEALYQLKQKAALKKVTIMWDGEPNALRSALDAAGQIKALGIEVSIALLPPGKDPNEVDAYEIYRAWKDATPYSKLLAVRWITRNPYDQT